MVSVARLTCMSPPLVKNGVLRHSVPGSGHLSSVGKLSFYCTTLQLSLSVQSWTLSTSMTINAGEGATTILSHYLP